MKFVKVRGRRLVAVASAACLMGTLGLVGLTASASSASSAKATHGGTFQIAFQSDPTTFDPQVCYDATCWDNMEMIFNRLYDYQTNNTTLEPEAAASMPKVSANGLVYTIAIRPGMKFSNGKPVTAADFAYTFSRICNPATKSPVVGILGRGVGLCRVREEPHGLRVGHQAGRRADPADHPHPARRRVRLRDDDAPRVGDPHGHRCPAGAAPAGFGPLRVRELHPGSVHRLEEEPVLLGQDLPVHERRQ